MHVCPVGVSWGGWVVSGFVRVCAETGREGKRGETHHISGFDYLLENLESGAADSNAWPYLSGILRGFKQAYKVRFIAFDFLIGNWSPFNL